MIETRECSRLRQAYSAAGYEWTRDLESADAHDLPAPEFRLLAPLLELLELLELLISLSYGIIDY